MPWCSKSKKEQNKLVYAKQRFQPNTSPFCIFIPRREMMFKMMRACIEVKTANDLWLNKENTTIEEFDIVELKYKNEHFMN